MNQDQQKIIDALELAKDINGKYPQLYEVYKTQEEFIDEALSIAREMFGEKKFDFLAHLHNQRRWSEQTFGPGERTAGVVDHIAKELHEVLENPTDITEWIDVVILALDGAWRAGFSPEQIIAALQAKQAKNEARKWPDWRTAEPGKAIEHIKDKP